MAAGRTEAHSEDVTAEDAEVARLLEVWVALRRAAVKKRTPEAQAAADAAYAAYRDRLVGGVPPPRAADESERPAPSS